MLTHLMQEHQTEQEEEARSQAEQAPLMGVVHTSLMVVVGHSTVAAAAAVEIVVHKSCVADDHIHHAQDQ